MTKKLTEGGVLRTHGPCLRCRPVDPQIQMDSIATIVHSTEKEGHSSQGNFRCVCVLSSRAVSQDLVMIAWEFLATDQFVQTSEGSIDCLDACYLRCLQSVPNQFLVKLLWLLDQFPLFALSPLPNHSVISS